MPLRTGTGTMERKGGPPMSEWLPFSDQGGSEQEPEHTVHVDPTRALQETRRRWEVRSAQWRARALAEAVFGSEVRVHLQGAGAARGLLRGMLHMDVPFTDLDVHRWRERVFRACAADDPVLARVPLVYVFRPRPPVASDGPAHGAGAPGGGTPGDTGP